jgi:shikimate dehydrogenase
MIRPNSNTELCISISSNPGNFGNNFHNIGYEILNLNYIYKSFKFNSIENLPRIIRDLNIKGCSVSMPFKQKVISKLDELSDDALKSNSVNTILNSNNYLKGFNTDCYGFFETFRELNLSKENSVLIFGSGGVTSSIVFKLFDTGYKNLTVVSRNDDAVEGLKLKFKGLKSKKLDDEFGNIDLFVNATPLGMKGYSSELLLKLLKASAPVKAFDLVVSNSKTDFIESCIQKGIQYKTGIEMTIKQACQQFKIYTSYEAPLKEIMDVMGINHET